MWFDEVKEMWFQLEETGIFKDNTAESSQAEKLGFYHLQQVQIICFLNGLGSVVDLKFAVNILRVAANRI